MSARSLRSGLDSLRTHSAGHRSRDGRTRPWELLLFTVLVCSPLRAASPPITAVAFVPGGEQVVVGSQAGIEVRHWPDLAPVRSISTSLLLVHDIAFSPDGALFVAAGGAPGDAGTVELWQTSTWERLATASPHTDVIYKIAWRSDGKQIACAGADQAISLVEVPSLRVDATLVGHSRAVTCLAYLPGDHFLVSGGLDATLRVWDLSQGEVVRSLTNHTAAVRDVIVQPNADPAVPVIASAGADKTIRLWQPLSGRLLRFARVPSEPLDLDWTPDGKRAVVTCADGHVRLVDADSVAILGDVPVAEGWAYSLAIHRDGRQAVVGGSGGALRSVPID